MSVEDLREGVGLRVYSGYVCCEVESRGATLGRKS